MVFTGYDDKSSRALRGNVLGWYPHPNEMGMGWDGMEAFINDLGLPVQALMGPDRPRRNWFGGNRDFAFKRNVYYSREGVTNSLLILSFNVLYQVLYTVCSEGEEMRVRVL